MYVTRTVYAPGRSPWMRKLPSVPAIAPVTRAPSALVLTATEARAIGALASASTMTPRISPGAAGGCAPGGGPPCARARMGTTAATTTRVRATNEARLMVNSGVECMRTCSNRTSVEYAHVGQYVGGRPRFHGLPQKFLSLQIVNIWRIFRTWFSSGKAEANCRSCEGSSTPLIRFFLLAERSPAP